MDKRAVRIATGVALGALTAVVAVSLLMTGAGGATAFDTNGAVGGDSAFANKYESVCAAGVAVPNPADNEGLAADCSALLTMQETLVGTGSLDWSSERRIHSWEGVGIDLVNDDTEYRVTQVTLNDKGLTGAISEAVGKLVMLEELYLHNNQLTGAIPAEMGSLARLETLHLANNRLTGAIPAELGGLVRLRTLMLHNNRLTGGIPSELSALVNLRLMGFGGNEFSGCIPNSMRGILRDSDARQIGLPYCDAATATVALEATATAAAGATATAERWTATPTAVHTATATRAPTAAPTATRTPVPTATRAPASGDVLERLIALERQVAALASRVAALERGSQGVAPTATPTSVSHNCVFRTIRAGASVGGNWEAGCVTSHPPASNPGGTYYARFYTFTLDSASGVTITLSSPDAAPHLLLMEGAGAGGTIVQEASPISPTTAVELDTITIRAGLLAGSYTIEATTYYAGETGDFTLSMEVGN